MKSPEPTGTTATWLCGLYRIEESYPVFTVLTREPSEKLSMIHDRMPLILSKNMVDEWINPDSKPAEILPNALTEVVIEKA